MLITLSQKTQPLQKACPVPEGSSNVDHFVAYSFLTSEAEIKAITANPSLRKYVLDDNVHNTYATGPDGLLSKVVGYSAGLLDYFFRGTLEISPPDRQVYAVTDGSVIPQKFTALTANVKNITPNELIRQGTTNGTLTAIARYKIDANYAPDLTNTPTHNTAAPFKYSVSKPVTIDSDQFATINTEPTEFTFDFSGESAIPAGITDLTLQVVFQGTLGNEENIAVAVGMSDLSEPTHHVIWNLSDMFSLDYHLHTAYEIINTPELAERAAGAMIDPYDITFTIGYTGDPNSTSFSPEVTEKVLPPGRHMRLIGIFDIEKANFIELRWSELGNEKFAIEAIQPVKNQDYGETWLSAPAATPYRNWLDTNGVTKRSFFQHYSTGLLRCKPPVYDANGKTYCTYPVEEAIPADKTPVTVTIE